MAFLLEMRSVKTIRPDDDAGVQEENYLR